MLSLPKKVYKTGREVVDWKQVDKGYTVEVEDVEVVVVSNENVSKTSKTSGKDYKTRRLVITDVNESVELEVGADSFKKGSFIKRFKKLLASVVVVVGLGTGTEVVEEPQVEVAEIVEVVETEPVAEVLDAEIVSVEEENPPIPPVLLLNEPTVVETVEEETFTEMTPQEQTDFVNSFYEEVGKQGLWDDFNDYVYGDKEYMSGKLLGALFSSIGDDEEEIDWDELQTEMNKEDEEKRKWKQVEQTVKEDTGKRFKKGKCTRIDILDAQEILKGEPEYINAKSWSYEVL